MFVTVANNLVKTSEIIFLSVFLGVLTEHKFLAGRGGRAFLENETHK
jgi:hypothetical protein